MQEAGLAGYDLGIWFNLGVVKRTPAPIVARLREAMERIATPQTAERLRTAFVEPLSVPAAQGDAWIAASATRWQAIAREMRLTAD